MAKRQALYESARESLRIDHEALDVLCVEVIGHAEGGDWPACDAAWNEFARKVEAHMGLEEMILLPILLKNAPPLAHQAGQIRREHRALRRAIGRLDAAVQARRLRAEDVRELVEALRRHAEVEGATLYALADSVTSPEAA